MKANKKLMKEDKNELKTILINLRITKSLSRWLKKNKFSPTKIWDHAVKELGYRK